VRRSFKIQYPQWFPHPHNQTHNRKWVCFRPMWQLYEYKYTHKHTCVRQSASKDLQNIRVSCEPRTWANPIRFWMPNAHISLDCIVIILPLFKTSCRGQRLLSLHLSQGLRGRNVFANIIKNVNEFVCLPTSPSVRPLVSQSLSQPVSQSVSHSVTQSVRHPVWSARPL